MALTCAAHKKPRTMNRMSQRRQKIVSGVDQQFTRYYKTAESVLGFIDVTSIRLWLRHLST